jgi:hypothetical protein
LKNIIVPLTDDQYRIAQAIALLAGAEFDQFVVQLVVDMLSIELERWFDGASMLPEMYKAIGRTGRA